jgi:polyphosphate kinase
MRVTSRDKFENIIESSDLISRDLSWMKFNDRVLDQSKKSTRSIFEKIKFLAITASNLDEFFMIRVGSLV